MVSLRIKNRLVLIMKIRIWRETKMLLTFGPRPRPQWKIWKRKSKKVLRQRKKKLPRTKSRKLGMPVKKVAPPRTLEMPGMAMKSLMLKKRNPKRQRKNPKRNGRANQGLTMGQTRAMIRKCKRPRVNFKLKFLIGLIVEFWIVSAFWLAAFGAQELSHNSLNF